MDKANHDCLSGAAAGGGGEFPVLDRHASVRGVQLPCLAAVPCGGTCNSGKLDSKERM